MREFITIVKTLLEGEIIDLQKHKFDKAFGEFTDTISGLVQGEQDFYAQGKFMPLAKTYIDKGFAPEFIPVIEIDVTFRDYRLGPEAAQVREMLRAQRFKIYGATKWAKGSRPKDNPNQEPHGPWGAKKIDFNTARELFAERESSPYGAYQTSRLGMGLSRKNIWDDRGVGFCIMVSGYDSRRGDKYGKAVRHETHIIDDEDDMREVSAMFVAIARAKMKPVD